MIIDLLFQVAPKEIDVDFNSGLEVDLGFEMGTVISDDPREHYHGSYEITPAITEQNLETDNKIMDDDVTIFAIPYLEVSNPSGGKTVTIG